MQTQDLTSQHCITKLKNTTLEDILVFDQQMNGSITNQFLLLHFYVLIVSLREPL